MPWQEKHHPTPLDDAPPPGLYFLDGDLLSRRYQQEWTRGHKYPVIAYPSGLLREFSTDPEEAGGTINVFGAFALSQNSTRDEGFQQAIAVADQYGYTVARRGETQLLVFHPYTARGYAVSYDNDAQRIADIKRFPDYAMDLLDAESRAVLPPLYATEKRGRDTIASVKFFMPDGSWTWYPTEYDGADTFFGLVSGLEVELGYFSLTELEGVKGSLGLPIERDLYFKPTTLQVLQEYHRRY